MSDDDDQARLRRHPGESGHAPDDWIEASLKRIGAALREALDVPTGQLRGLVYLPHRANAETNPPAVRTVGCGRGFSPCRCYRPVDRDVYSSRGNAHHRR